MKKWWEDILKRACKIIEMPCFDGLPIEVKDEIAWIRDTAYSALQSAFEVITFASQKRKKAHSPGWL